MFSIIFKTKFIITLTTGHNHLDLDALERRNVQIISKGEALFLDSVTATAELTGIDLPLTRKIPQAQSHVKSGGWNRDAFMCDLSGRTLGIVGYGRLEESLRSMQMRFAQNILINDIRNLNWCLERPD